jgi:hypothetical protein
MSFLPIADRELRVAARKRSTFWLRVAAAIVGLIIGSGFMLIATLQPAGLPSMGSVLFGALTWICVIAAFCAGIFFTADCLSEEKREGTLGFLFLTDLRGYDVVLGKLAATSLRCLFGMLAICPILAITLLMGGVTGLQFWKTVLALTNSLFLSLAAGLVISAVGRDSQKVMGGTLVLLLILIVAGPIADGIIAAARKRAFMPHWSLSSAGYAFTSAGDWGKTLFWRALLTSHVLGWLCLVLACLFVPRTWQERANKRSATKGRGYALKYGGERRRTSLRRKLLDRDPVLWLACRERWQSVGIWIIALTVTGAMAVAVSKSIGGTWLVWTYLGWLFTMLIYLWAASQACRFLFDVRRSGLIELLLASPITEREIVRGQWRAFFRLFGVPVLLMMAVHVTGVAMSQGAWKNAVVSATTKTSGATQTFALSMNEVFPFIGAALAACAMVGNLVALAWFGMWMGFTSKNATLATLKTIAFVQIIPSMVISFGSSMLLMMLIIPWARKSGPSAPPSWVMSLYPFLSVVLASLLSLGKDIAFILWSRKRLYFSFRERAAREISPVQVFSPPSVPPPIAAPPLIAGQS